MTNNVMKECPAELYDASKPFIFFHGGYQSQWAMAEMVIAGERFNCCEQYMMAEKAKVFDDYATRKKIMQARRPKEQKALGRKVAHFKPATWDKHKFGIVVRGNLAKFTQNLELKQKLLETGDRVLVEASPNDTIWGIGLHEADPAAKDISQWDGTNLLGQALMVVREQIRKEEGSSASSSTTADASEATQDIKSPCEAKKQISEDEASAEQHIKEESTDERSHKASPDISQDAPNHTGKKSSTSSKRRRWKDKE